MEIKDAIISTLAEIDKLAQDKPKPLRQKQKTTSSQPQRQKATRQNPKKTEVKQPSIQKNTSKNLDEIEYLKSLKERMLVLFEGLQSPQNKNIEDKLEITINFLEFTLATIQERLKAHGG